MDNGKMETFSKKGCFIKGIKGCLMPILALILFMVVIDLLVPDGSTNTITTNEPQSTIQTETKKTTEKEIFENFEKELYAIPTECDKVYNNAFASVDSKDFISTYENFDKAGVVCMKVSSEMQNLKIPKKINKKTRKMMTSAINDIIGAYIFRYSACQNFKKYIKTEDKKYIIDAKKDLDRFDRNLFNGVGSLATIKSELK